MKRLIFRLKITLVPLVAAAVCLIQPVQAGDRNYISIVGSSTVYPFATVVAERFGTATVYKTPIIESTGSGGGLKLFCAGIGLDHPDIANASRRIKKSEVQRCAENGIAEIVEIKFGYDGIVIANSVRQSQYRLTKRQVFLALAKDVPSPDGTEKLVSNPYVKWSDIDASLPDVEIRVLGPPPTSGTRDAFAELGLEGGCKTFGWIEAIKEQDENAYKAICHTVREDGAWVEAGENDNLIVKKIQADSRTLGVFGFSFLDQNPDIIQGAVIDGVAPEFENIADGSYAISRPLYFYVKSAHLSVIPGIAEFVEEFTAERTWSENGYLADKGMIPMPPQERSSFALSGSEMTSLVLE